MKLTKRMKEIIKALNNGARLIPPGFLSHQWELKREHSREWVYDSLVKRMVLTGVLKRELDLEGYRHIWKPTPAALEACK